MNESMRKWLQGAEQLYPVELEQRFPRILNKIAELWGTSQLESYFTELMIDNRGGNRQGFPKEIAAEIYRLSQEHDRQMRRPEPAAPANPWEHIDIRKQQALEELGYECTLEDFLRSAEANNREAVGLYLSAGFPLEAKDERGWTPLMISSFNGNAEIAELLIRSGADVRATDNAGYGPMHWAAFNGYAGVVRLLIVKRADVNARSLHGWTPLLQAATRGQLAACRALIAGGADVNLASNDGWTPLHKACANGHLDVVQLLLAQGANRNAQYQDGVTPRMLAAKNKRDDILALFTE